MRGLRIFVHTVSRELTIPQKAGDRESEGVIERLASKLTNDSSAKSSLVLLSHHLLAIVFFLLLAFLNRLAASLSVSQSPVIQLLWDIAQILPVMAILFVSVAAAVVVVATLWRKVQRQLKS